MRTERRCIPRKRPGGISYFEFEAGSGGIVLDASEKGLAFQAADAVQQLGPSRIFISPHPEERIALNGDVVWTDRSKKTGGLRFIDLGADSGNRIRDWLKQAGESGVSHERQEYPLPTWVAQEVPDIPRGSSNLDTSPIPPLPMQGRGPRPVEPRLAPILLPLMNPDLTLRSQDSSGVRRGFIHHIATGFLIVVFVLACVAIAQNLGLVAKIRPKVADALIRLGEKLNGTTDSQSRISSPLPLPQVPTPPPSAAPSIPDAPQPEPLASSGRVNSSAQNNSETPSLNIPRTKEDADHSAYSQPSSLAPERSVEVSRLWSEVGAGSSAAEVALARLYLKGEGVPRNCEQARILLRAAAKGGNREARQQLQKLRTYGCR